LPAQLMAQNSLIRPLFLNSTQSAYSHEKAK
jgi:hypothetical protein